MDKNCYPDQSDEEYVEKMTNENPKVVLTRQTSKKSGKSSDFRIEKYLSLPIKKGKEIKFFGGGHTSKVSNIKISKETGEIMIETGNSIYKLEILDKKLPSDAR